MHSTDIECFRKALCNHFLDNENENAPLCIATTQHNSFSAVSLVVTSGIFFFLLLLLSVCSLSFCWAAFRCTMYGNVNFAAMSSLPQPFRHHMKYSCCLPNVCDALLLSLCCDGAFSRLWIPRATSYRPMLWMGSVVRLTPTTIPKEPNSTAAAPQQSRQKKKTAAAAEWWLHRCCLTPIATIHRVLAIFFSFFSTFYLVATRVHESQPTCPTEWMNEK